MNVKQVIIVRTDLDMPIGRIPSQVAHAAIKIFTDRMEIHEDGNTDEPYFAKISGVTSEMKEWLTESFTKVVLKVHSQEELLTIKSDAELLGLPNAIISDGVKGKTEYTALAIGPAFNDKLDPLVKGLKLL